MTFRLKREDTFTPGKVWFARNSSCLLTDSWSTNPVRQLCQLTLVQAVQCVLLLVPRLDPDSSSRPVMGSFEQSPRCDQPAFSQPVPQPRFRGTKSNSRGSLILSVKCSAVSARSTRSWAKKESLMHTDLYRVASSLFRIGLFLPSNTSLSCSFSRGVLTALVFVLHPDSLMMSGACLKSVQCPSTVQFDQLQL